MYVCGAVCPGISISIFFAVVSSFVHNCRRILFWTYIIFAQNLDIFIGPESDHCLPLSLTDSLTHSCLVNLIDVILACEDANSKLVDVVTVADEDRVGNNLLLRFGQAFEFEVQARLASGVWPVFSADVLKRL